ncbi:hypothetical protein ACQP10_20565 [Streptosporangium sandarakinum]|uniref:hypothetical protein n=1 Tax=Streptosporangium sandarakinum TaxID=1260955 RepID=UPI003D8EEE2D
MAGAAQVHQRQADSGIQGGGLDAAGLRRREGGAGDGEAEGGVGIGIHLDGVISGAGERRRDVVPAKRAIQVLAHRQGGEVAVVRHGCPWPACVG